MIPTPITTNFRSQALSDVELHLEARSIFATGPMNGLSHRYKFVPTTEIVGACARRTGCPSMSNNNESGSSPDSVFKSTSFDSVAPSKCKLSTNGMRNWF